VVPKKKLPKKKISNLASASASIDDQPSSSKVEDPIYAVLESDEEGVILIWIFIEKSQCDFISI